MKINKTKDRWVVEKGRKLHTHDIATISISQNGKQNWIVSGGLDTLLIRQSLEDMDSERKDAVTFRIDPFPQFPLYSCTKNQDPPLLLTSLDNVVQIWSLGRAQDTSMNQSQLSNFKELPLQESVRQLLQLDLKTSLPIYTSCISPNGKFIAASDTNNLFVFSFSTRGDKVNLKRVTIPGLPKVGVIRITFTDNQIIIATSNGSIFVGDLFSQIVTEFTKHCYDNHGSIHSLVVSEDGQWLASSDTKNHIHVYNLDVMKVRYYTLLREREVNLLFF